MTIDKETSTQKRRRIRELDEQNAALVEALKDLLAMAKFYKPLPKPSNPEDEDEEMWSIAMLYIQAEKAIALSERKE